MHDAQRAAEHGESQLVGTPSRERPQTHAAPGERPPTPVASRIAQAAVLGDGRLPGDDPALGLEARRVRGESTGRLGRPVMTAVGEDHPGDPLPRPRGEVEPEAVRRRGHLIPRDDDPHDRRRRRRRVHGRAGRGVASAAAVEGHPREAGPRRGHHEGHSPRPDPTVALAPRPFAHQAFERVVRRRVSPELAAERLVHVSHRVPPPRSGPRGACPGPTSPGPAPSPGGCPGSGPPPPTGSP